MIFLYRIYQIFIMFPILIAGTIVASIVTIAGSLLGGGRWFGYYPAHWWARMWCVMSLVRVEVRGRENIQKGTSYVFVANHQGSYDIFSIYGYLGHTFRWMMKKSLERIPLVGYACRVAGHIYVDNSSPLAVRHTMDEARKQLAGGESVIVFPEGSRTPDGRMHAFKRGAFLLATGLDLPVVPITIDGAYKVMPRTALLPRPGKIVLTIHKPIEPDPQRGHGRNLMQQSYDAIASALPEEQD